MNAIVQRLLLLLPLFFSPFASADYPLEIIELKGRTLEEVLPLVRPFIDPDGAVSGMNNQLVLRTSPANLREIRKLLERIDKPPQRLLISVRQQTASTTDQDLTRAGIDVHLGKRGRVTLGAPGRDGTVQLQGMQGSTQGDATLVSQIQTVSGRPAFIATGRSVPVGVQQRLADGTIRYYQGTTRYRDATSGFYARPQVNGDHVTIDISPFSSQTGRTPGEFDTAGATTRINTRLGEWTALGGVSRQGLGSGSGPGLNASTRMQLDRQIEIKVDLLR
jgi:type II secretory pathway component GspD/PulD (secretin)